jgi:hypothetical protein
MYSVVSGKRRKNFVVGLAVKVHGENGVTLALILNLLLDGSESTVFRCGRKITKSDY